MKHGQRLVLLLLLMVVATSVHAQDAPTVAKDSFHITLNTSAERGGYAVRGWRPYFEYRVNGPIASGSQLSVEFSPGAKGPIAFDCETGETEAGNSWKTQCGGEAIPSGKAVV